MEDPYDDALTRLVADVRASAASAETRKTLLLVDTSPDESSLSYFQSGYGGEDCIILDALRLHLLIHARREKLPKLLEETRRRLVFAMIHGKTLVVRLNRVAMNFNAFNDEAVLSSCDRERDPWPPYSPWSFLPSFWLLQGGKVLRDDSQTTGQMIRRGDYEGDQKPTCHNSFTVLFTTTTPLEDVNDRLFSPHNPCLPGSCKEEHFDVFSLK